MNPKVMRDLGYDEVSIRVYSKEGKKETEKYELFKIELGMWVELLIGGTWVIGQIMDINASGRTLWVETHEDVYEINRIAEHRRIRPL